MKKLAQFDDAWMAAFRDKSGVSDEAALTALRADLLEIGARYRRIIETTPTDLVGSPFNKTLTQRAEWMQVNVVCGSAWKRDPGSGVIGVEKGPLIPVV